MPQVGRKYTDRRKVVDDEKWLSSVEGKLKKAQDKSQKNVKKQLASFAKRELKTQRKAIFVVEKVSPKKVSD